MSESIVSSARQLVRNIASASPMRGPAISSSAPIARTVTSQTDVAKLIEQVATGYGLTTFDVEPCFRSPVHTRWCLAIFGLDDKPAEPCPPELNQLIIKLVTIGRLTYDVVKRLGLEGIIHKYVVERMFNILAEVRGVAEIEEELARLKGIIKSALKNVTPELEKSIMESIRRSVPTVNREQIVAIIEALKGNISPRDAAMIIKGSKPTMVEEENKAEKRSQTPAKEALATGKSVRPVAG